MATQALVCPACRTWYEARGRRPHCPSCGAVYSDTPPSSSRRYQTVATPPEASHSARGAAARPEPDADDLQTPAFLGRSPDGYRARASIFGTLEQLTLIPSAVIFFFGLSIGSLPIVMVAIGLFIVPMILDALFTRSSDSASGAWFRRYRGRE